MNTTMCDPRVPATTALMPWRLCAALLFVCLWGVPFAQGETFRARVVGVTDGDTVKVLTGDQRELTLRLASIDSCSE